MIDDTIDKLLLTAEKLIPLTLLPDQPPGKYSDQPEWYMFEHDIWKLGEQIRLFLVENKKYKLNDSQLKRINQIATNKNAKNGRQSFIMLLGYKKYQSYSSDIASQIYDSNVAGQVIDTLLKMQAPGYGEIIRPFTTSKFLWIKKKAKKYIERYDSE